MCLFLLTEKTKKKILFKYYRDRPFSFLKKKSLRPKPLFGELTFLLAAEHVAQEVRTPRLEVEECEVEECSQSGSVRAHTSPKRGMRGGDTPVDGNR
ncbi:hypothetical protein CEXT_731961 [Caerostris extrusa]|uniref:Uncharacterized protein n=1 Tax=Caerostris extrusa TaxID=172846 RepID=A0AAV4NFG5_CAEEX|nr:hypothetical protein CEXT_731961 [Caerostris extrusa]